MNNHRKLSAIIASILTLNASLTAENVTDDICASDRVRSHHYLEEQPLYSRGTPDFKPVERGDELAVSLNVIPSNGYTLTKDLTFDGEFKGIVKAGSVFEASAFEDGFFCILPFHRSLVGKRPYTCVTDTDGDQVFDTIFISKWRNVEKRESIQVSDPELFLPNQYIVSKANELGDLPSYTIAYGRAITVRKVGKKYVRVSLGNAVGAKTLLSKKAAKRCGDMCMSFNGDYSDKKIYYNNPDPVELGGVAIRTNLDDTGNVLMATEGTLETPDLEKSCDDSTFSVEGMRLEINVPRLSNRLLINSIGFIFLATNINEDGAHAFILV